MKQTIILTGALTLSLLGSYLTWTSDSPEVTEDGVAVFTATEIAAVTYTSKNVDVSIEKRADPAGDYHWVTVTERKRIKKPKPEEAPPEAEEAEGEASADEEKSAEEDAPTEAKEEGEEAAEKEALPEAPEEAEEEETVETTVHAFRGNDTSNELWEALSPLQAIRKLETDPSAEALGFSGDKAGQLTIRQSSGELVMDIGGETYGSKDRYLKHNGSVFLVEDKHLRSISSAKARLIERRIHPLTEKEIASVSLTYGDQKTTLTQQNADDRAAAFWAREGESEADSAAGTWLGKLFRVKIQSYEETDPGLLLTPVFTATVAGQDGSWTIEFFSEGTDSNPDYYAKSSFNQSLVKLTKSLASDAAQDISAIFNSAEATP